MSSCRSRAEPYIRLAIRRRRKMQGLTQDALAAAAELTSEEIRNYEGGVTPVPASALARIARALGCDVEGL